MAGTASKPIIAPTGRCWSLPVMLIDIIKGEETAVHHIQLALRIDFALAKLDIQKRHVLLIKLLPLISKSGLGVVDFVFLERNEKGRVKQVKE